MDIQEYEYSDSESINLSFPSKKTHSCTFESCDKAFDRPWKLNAHLRVHNNERPFKCKEPSCDKAYTKESTLKKHVEEFHQKKIQNGMCPFKGCLKTMRLNSLRKHILRFHSPLNIKPKTQTESYKCEICEKVFTKGSRFRWHVKSHKNYECATCKEQYYDYKVFRRHQTECKISADPSLVICDKCDKRFISQSNLRQHQQNVHDTETKPKEKFKCEEEGCLREFEYLKNLKAHVFERHTPGSTELLYKWICHICSKKFKRKIYCKNHILNCHLNDSNKVPKDRKPRSDKGVRKDIITILTGFSERNISDCYRTRNENVPELVQENKYEDVLESLNVEEKPKKGPRMKFVPNFRKRESEGDTKKNIEELKNLDLEMKHNENE